MLKTALSLIIIIPCIITATIAQTTRTVKQDETLQGRVMQVTQVNLEKSKTQTGPTVLDTMMKITLKFDKKGNEAEEVVYITNSINIYTDKKHVQKFVTTYAPHYSKQGIIDQVIALQDTFKHITSYNEKGKVREDKFVNFGGKTLYELTPNDQIERALYVNTRGDTSVTIKYTYNQQGFIIKAQNFKPGNTLDASTYYLYKAYDDRGNWTKRTVQTDYKNGTSSPESIQERVYIYYK